MNNKEAIAELKAMPINYPLTNGEDKASRLIQARDIAIKALEQEPCDDAINREDALMCLTGEIKETDTIETIIARFVRRIRKLPPVNTQSNTGHWIMPVQDDGMSEPIYYQVRCSKCGFDLDPQTWHMELHQYGADKYCPNCGAKMVEP